jgi:hypothetical protein
MSLDLFLQSGPEMPPGGDGEYVCSLEDDGYYWFLEPFFGDLAEQTGQYVGLYGGAVFGGAALEVFQRTLAAARERTAAMPDRWEVVTGLRPGAVSDELRAEVVRAELEALLDRLDAAAARATAVGQYLKFFGD